jgi:DNA-binding MarR family transcriptional regulator
MTTRLTRALVAAELPVLDRHQLSMWGYSVLTALESGPVGTQAALAESINADKSRLIGVLDDLQARGLIERAPDPADRRARLLSITPAGHQLRASVQSEIQRNEQRLLAQLPESDRAGFLNGLGYLAALPPAEFLGDHAGPPEISSRVREPVEDAWRSVDQEMSRDWPSG